MNRVLARSLVALTALSIGLATRAAPVQQSPIARVVARMSTAEKIGQLVMFSVQGEELTPGDRRAMVDLHLGAVIVFRDNYRNPEQLSVLTRGIQRAARAGNRFEIGAIVAADQEGGSVKRFPDMPPWRSAPELGETGSSDTAYRQGRITGRALGDAGVNVDLAPVADLDLPPSRVMADRSFGEAPQRVARLASAFARGLQDSRVAATAKHFPGFGGATINSDYGAAYIYRTKRELHRIDIVPFEALAERAIAMVMLSHGMYVNDGGYRPASITRYIATSRLREEAAFEGVAISDALEAIAWYFDDEVAPACPATIAAGADIALITGHLDVARACVGAIRSAVQSGEISARRLDQAVTRVLQLKEWLEVWQPPLPPPSPSPSPSTSPTSSGPLPSIRPPRNGSS